MHRFLLPLALLALLCSSCDMPNHAAQVEQNEKKLSAEGIQSLKVGDPAPPLDLQGTLGSHLQIGESLPDTGTTPATPITDEAAPAIASPAEASETARPESSESAEQPGGSEPSASEAGAEPTGAAQNTPTDGSTGQPPAAAATSSTANPANEAAAGNPPATDKPSGPLGSFTALYFFPAPDTPNSTHQLLGYGKQLAGLAEDGISLYGVCVADLSTLESYVSREGITVPLLADVNGDAGRAYGCLPAPGRFAQRTTVLIGPDGKVILWQRGMVSADALIKAAGLGEKLSPGKADK